MALKKVSKDSYQVEDTAVNAKTRQLFTDNIRRKETKILTTFSIEPSFKKELEDKFEEMGLGWAAGIRFALKEFIKKYNN